MIAQVEYKGQLRTEAKHLRSGSVIVTDAPIDNQGKGEAFSPTDLVATALASCMITIMGIVAERDGIDIEGVTADVDKIMSKEPRRIGEIKIIITFKSILTTDFILFPFNCSRWFRADVISDSIYSSHLVNNLIRH